METQNLPETEVTPSLTEVILTAYRNAVNNLENIQSKEEFEIEKIRLAHGYREGSAVVGVTDFLSVEAMFMEVISHPTSMDKNLTSVTADGDMAWVFNLVDSYKGKGHSTIATIAEIEKANWGKSLGIAKDYDPEHNTYSYVAHAAGFRFLKCDVITIITSQDQQTFLAWFCGKPKKIWTPSNVHTLLSKNGNIDIGELEVHIGVDYEKRNEFRRNQFKGSYNFSKVKSKPKIKFVAPPPINSMQEAMADLDKVLEESEQHKS
jgi:DNA-binding phage protein